MLRKATETFMETDVARATQSGSSSLSAQVAELCNNKNIYTWQTTNNIEYLKQILYALAFRWRTRRLPSLPIEEKINQLCVWEYFRKLQNWALVKLKFKDIDLHSVI
eukprot:GHVT01025502.1.p1 GENE.GHVT01025502.1~~GHVT01025502.1.p1  ORF type:complete len:107 (-),score=2.56 GHVT01025502.1:1519-1839(-)